ncbi:MAG: hypothetical protein AABX64_00115 [Nanoarchaeota archaeon]
MTLETITGNLRDAYRQLQPGTMLHADELMNERIDNPKLRDQWFYTADGEVYFLKGKNKTPTLAMTREAHNPVLQNIDAAFEQLINRRNYPVPQADFKQALAAPDTTLIALPKLRLSVYNAEFSYLPIGTTPAEYKTLNAEERTFTERVFGQGDDFVKNMEMLKNARIDETRIYVLDPKYVQKHASHGAIARVSWLYSFGDDSIFDAIDRDIYVHNRARGVRSGSEATEAPAGRGAQNTSASQESAKTPEGVLEEQVREELSRFKKYVSSLDQGLYAQDEQLAANNILAMLKK